jgi:S1-C subfamily serine protease
MALTQKGGVRAFIYLTFLFTGALRLAGISIDGYKSIVLPPATGNFDTGQYVAQTVRSAGMEIRTSVPPPAECAKCCVLNWSQNGNLTQYCEMTVTDALTGSVIAHSAESSRIRIGIPANVRGSIEKAWKALRYHGFNTLAYEANLRELFPSRPTYALTETEVRAMQFTAPIEGLWASADNTYLIAMVKDKRHQTDVVGVVLHSDLPTWSTGEIKMELRETASSLIYMGDVYMANKRRLGTSLLLDPQGATMTYEEILPSGAKSQHLFIKTFPKSTLGGFSGEIASIGSWTGSGFLISGSGLVATNYHVAGKARSLKARFPQIGKEFPARIVLKDPNNDLAIVQLDQFSLAAINQTEIPYGFAKSKTVGLGDPVYAIGYPISEVMGQNPKYSNGSINSKSGMGDDMVHYQISVPVQPGNSGSPLFNGSGDVVGIVVATLTETQNVNYAIKSDYLINLTEMLPEVPAMGIKSRKPAPDQIGQFVCLLIAQ